MHLEPADSLLAAPCLVIRQPDCALRPAGASSPRQPEKLRLFWLQCAIECEQHDQILPVSLIQYLYYILFWRNVTIQGVSRKWGNSFKRASLLRKADNALYPQFQAERRFFL